MARLKSFFLPSLHLANALLDMKLRILLLLTLCLTQFGNAADYKLPATDDDVPGQGTLRRQGWFQNLWEKRRSAWAKEVQQDQGALVFLGDSITQGWGACMGNSFPGVKVANRGF